MNEKIVNRQVLEDYRTQLLQEEKSPATVEKYMRDAAGFLHFCGGAELTKELVISYKKALIDRGYEVRSINSMLASLNSLMRYMDCPQLQVKTLKIQRTVYCPEEKELTRSEYERLCRAARSKDVRLYLLLQTICATGIRVSELQFITVKAVQRGEAVVSCKAKTRSVFIVRDLQQRLLRYIERCGIKDGPVFVTRSGRPMDRVMIWREMKKLCALAKVDPGKVFPHNLRHLFARAFYRVEKDIAKLADILGHSSIETTRIYIKSTGVEHRRYMEQMRLII